jgi:hypothetical protein
VNDISSIVMAFPKDVKVISTLDITCSYKGCKRRSNEVSCLSSVTHTLSILTYSSVAHHMDTPESKNHVFVNAVIIAN